MSLTGYAADHASALADIRDAGARVTFTRTARTYDPNTDLPAVPYTTTIDGYAIRTRGDPDTYRALSLVEATSPTLFFVPDDFGGDVEEGDTVVWAGTTYTVAALVPVGPDGVTIAARVTCS